MQVKRVCIPSTLEGMCIQSSHVDMTGDRGDYLQGTMMLRPYHGSIDVHIGLEKVGIDSFLIPELIHMLQRYQREVRMSERAAQAKKK